MQHAQHIAAQCMAARSCLPGSHRLEQLMAHMLLHQHPEIQCVSAASGPGEVAESHVPYIAQRAPGLRIL